MKSKRVILYFVLVIIIAIFNFYLRPIKGNQLVDSKYKSSDAYINSLYMSDEYFKTKVLSKNNYFIYDNIIEGSLEDKSKVSFECDDKCYEDFFDAYYAIYLDHPELISFLGIKTFRREGNTISYTNYENLGKIKSKLGAMRIEREMENIRRDTRHMNDKEKIIYVYNYVASHNYDSIFTYIGSNQSAYSFFTKKSSVCAGFAKASQIIFQNIGISSYLVLSEEHMWNYVQYDDKYYIFDATVGASYYDKSSPKYYDGLGRTTTLEEYGMFSDCYPDIETKTSLKEMFDL